MPKKNFPFYRRILFWLLLPVSLMGILCSTLLVYQLSSPLKAFLIQQFDASLRLASIMGIQFCEDSFSDLLDLRLENNVEMNQTMQNETLGEIKAISSRFPHIHLMVLESGRTIRACSMEDSHQTLTQPLAGIPNDSRFVFQVNGRPVRAHLQSFPFWDWQIVSFMFEEDYRQPIRMAYTVTYMSSAGVFLAVLMTLLITYFLFVNRPLNRLITATKGVSQGKLSKIDRIARSELGQLMNAFNTMVDSLEKEKAEVRSLIHQLSESNRMLKLILNTIPVRVFWKDRDGAYRGANQYFAEDAGVSCPEDLVGKTDDDLAFFAQAKTLRRDDREVMGSGTAKLFYEVPQDRPGGEKRWLLTSKVPMKDDHKNIIGVLGTYQDITDRKLAEEELRKLRNYLSNIIDSMPSILIGVDAEGRITQWNRQAERVTGVSPDKAAGLPMVEAFPRLATEMERVKEAIAMRRVKLDPRQAKKENGQIRYEDVTIYPLVANGVGGAVIRIDDVTEQIRMEEMLIQNEKMLSLGGLAAGMAHEINNPLAGVIQNAHVLENRLTDPAIPANLKAAESARTTMEAIVQYTKNREIPRIINSITDSGMRMASIVENMLNFARKGDASFCAHDPVTLMDNTLALALTDYDLKRQYDFKAICIEKEYEKNLPAIACEGGKIQQVLLNLLNNGAHAMFEKKQSGTEYQPRFILRIVHETDSDMVRMEIQDNGKGIDEKTLKRIFEPFFTTKPVGIGTGLGLSVSYFIITENHGGKLDVTSTPGKGSNFIIRLPVSKGKIGAPA